MAVEVSALPIWVNAAVLLGAFALLIGLGERVLRTPMWVPLLMICSGIVMLALLSMAAGVAYGAGASDLAAKLQLAASSGLPLTIAGALQFGLVYPRRVRGRWVEPALLGAYGLALVYVFTAPLRVVADPSGGGQVAIVSGLLDNALGYPLLLSLIPLVAWFAYLGLKGRSEKERRAGRILSLSTGPPALLGIVWPTSGTAASNNDVTLLLFGAFILGLAGAVAFGGFPMPLQASLRRVIDSSRDAVVIIDADTTLVMHNKAAEELLGLKTADAGLPFELVIRPAFKDQAAWARISRRIGDAIVSGSQPVDDDAGPVGPSGTPCRAIVDPLRHRGAGGRADGVVVRIRDMTAQKLAEETSTRLHTLQDLVIRVMGHDLKAPIAVMQGNLELAKMDLGSATMEGSQRAGVAGRIDKANQAAAGMQVILANARAISRLEMAPGKAPKAVPADLARIVRDTADLLRPLAEAKAQTLVVSAPGEMRVPMPPGLESVVSNLLSNAIKYTPERGQVDVGLARHGDKAVFTVVDTGPGIAPDKRALLFKKFERLAAEQTTVSHGLGLSIAASIVELAGGTIGAFDRQDGSRGTLFRVELPAPEAAPNP